MRRGQNPAKLKINNKVEHIAYHQIIVPVHLPELKGYYQDGFEILKLCIKSISLTIHDKTFVSVVNNGSCKEVGDYLDNCLKKGKINEVIHTYSIGKINAIAKGLSGHDFDLVTITDADVLFTNGWQKAVYEIYENFPKAGMVGTSPSPLGETYLTENIFYDNHFKNSIKSVTPEKVEDIKLFYLSLNRSLVNTEDLKIKVIDSQADTIAVIGAGHFCSTYRKESLDEFFKKPYASLKMGGGIMKKYIDDPVFKLDLWRLSTFKNFTYHLGNVKEDWMIDKFNKIKKEHSIPKLILNKIPSNQPRFWIKFKSIVTRKFIYKKNAWN